VGSGGSVSLGSDLTVSGTLDLSGGSLNLNGNSLTVGNWCVGVLLMVLTLLLSFTGYLLPDDQLGFWAVTVGTNMARATPGLGNEGPFGSLLGMTPYNDVRFALLGGSIVDANALLRAYIWHCIAIPLIASVFMGVHFWRVRKDGGISGPAPVMLETEIKEEKGPRPVIMRPSGMV